MYTDKLCDESTCCMYNKKNANLTKNTGELQYLGLYQIPYYHTFLWKNKLVITNYNKVMTPFSSLFTLNWLAYNTNFFKQIISGKMI